ncbi:HAMP domain-containing histidine kinase [Pelosinus sp. IPA-1]|uniref:sensor histidine kinase n=1 Tax=Pelosinus sp. IPA-1 TaxID=3029569 RepID=UPI002552A99D|nr:HAMP domain-containing histidine kinase [Pelosinus sp. IPA-1]
MKRIVNAFSKLPIRWKLALGSALLLFCLIVLYNSIQYLVINQWVNNRERNVMQSTAAAIQDYFLDNDEDIGAQELESSKEFLEKINEQGQMIRIIQKDGRSILVVTKDIRPEWVTSEFVQTSRIIEGRHGEDHLLIVRTPLIIPHFTGTIEIVRNIRAVDQLLNVILTVMTAGGIVAILLSIVGGMVISRQLLMPIKDLTNIMKKVEEKGLQERVKVYEAKDELSALATMFNTMMDKLEYSFRQQKQFVEDASHELRTPIAIVEGHLSLLVRWGKDDSKVLEESLATSLQETKRLKHLVQDLLAVSQAEASLADLEKEKIWPVPIIEQAIQNMVLIHAEVDFSAELAALEEIQIAITSNHLEQILLILLDNGIKYSTIDKRVNILGYINAEYACIAIRDYGMGIPDSDLPHIFDRFYRVDKARSRRQGGSGLGLAIAKRLVEKYRGLIEVHSEVHVGTTIIIQLPIAIS